MFNNCCILSCASRRQDISFHMFPKSEIGLHKWLQCINCERLRSMSFHELRKHFVCRKHFEKRFLPLKRDRARLRPDAYPTLFTDSEISSGIPQKVFLDITETASLNFAAEHSYPRKRHNDHNYGKQPPQESHRQQNLKTTDNIHPLTEHTYSRKRHFDHTYAQEPPRGAALPKRTSQPEQQKPEESTAETPDLSYLEDSAQPETEDSNRVSDTGDHYDHNYSKMEDIEIIEENPVVVQEHPVDHLYTRPPGYVYADSHASSFPNTVMVVRQTSSAAEQALEQLDNYEVETLDYTPPETRGDDSYESAADSDSDTNSEASSSALRNEKQVQSFEECVMETTGLDQLTADGRPLDINTVKEPPRWSHEKDVCRACLSTSGAWDLTGTYLTEDGESERLLDMLTLCYGIKLSNISESSPSRFLCDVCAASLRHADNFRRQVLRAEANFTQYYGPGDHEIKEEYPGSDEDETLEKEVSCINKSSESMEQDAQVSRDISEPLSTARLYHRKRTKPSVEGSSTASQNHSMSEVSYSEKYIRVISYSANKNLENGSANKEINTESQLVDECENNEETNNHCDEDLLFSDIKRRKIGEDCQMYTLSMPENPDNILQTVEGDSNYLSQLLEMDIPEKNVMTFHPLSETNQKKVKRKTSSDTNIGDIDLFTGTVTHPDNLVQQTVSSDSIDFSQSVELTLPGNKVMRFLPF